MEEAKIEMITKSQASVEVLNVNAKLKTTALVCIVGSLIVYGVGVVSGALSIFGTLAVAGAGIYFYYDSTKREKYLIQKYNLKQQPQTYAPKNE